ncbi:hypothetical protein BJ165DRAFT_1490219, partial [Panaeolus papilionaceus]
SSSLRSRIVNCLRCNIQHLNIIIHIWNQQCLPLLEGEYLGETNDSQTISKKTLGCNYCFSLVSL